jgi:von Willebrand factor type A domain
MRLPTSHALSSGALLLAVTLVASGVACSGASPRPLGDDPGDGGDAGAPGSFQGDDAAPPDHPSDAGCATASTQAERQPVSLLFVLDGSGSMRDDNKWTAVVPALQSLFGELASADDKGIAAGLIVFSDSSDPTGGSGPYPSRADVPIASMSAAQLAILDRRLAGMPENVTPTHAALTGGYGELEHFAGALSSPPGAKKVLVLITDGVPSDDCQSFPVFADYASNPCIVLAAKELAALAPDGPIETFVVGVGDFGAGSFFGPTGIDPGFLGNLATAGGTGPSGCNPDETLNTSDLCYSEVDPSQADESQLQQNFEAALDAIRGRVVSCTFPLQSTNLGAADPTHVNVQIDGATLPQDAANGWTYDDPAAPTAILLHGSACASTEGASPAKVSIVLGCATQVAK